jgi:hypothetical protein
VVAHGLPPAAPRGGEREEDLAEGRPGEEDEEEEGEGGHG